MLIVYIFSKVKEVIWLELQAWFAGRNMSDQDKWLIRYYAVVFLFVNSEAGLRDEASHLQALSTLFTHNNAK